MRTYQFDKKGSEIQELLDQIKNKTIYGNATKDTAGLMSAEDKGTLDTLVDNVGKNIQQLNSLNQAVSENTTAIGTNTDNIATNTSDISALKTTTGNLGTRLDAAEETLDNIFQLDANNFMGIYDAAASLPAMTGAGWALVGADLTALNAYVYNIPQAQWQQYGNTTYDYSDYSGLATQVATIGSNLGDLSQLHTTDKTSLVNALNEVKDNSSTTAEDTSYEDNYGIGADNVQDAIDKVGFVGTDTEIDLTQFTEVRAYITPEGKWITTNNTYSFYGIFIPVETGANYRITGHLNSNTGYAFLTSNAVGGNNTAVTTFATGCSRIPVVAGEFVVDTAPSDARYLWVFTTAYEEGDRKPQKIETVKKSMAYKMAEIDENKAEISSMKASLTCIDTELGSITEKNKVPFTEFTEVGSTTASIFDVSLDAENEQILFDAVGVQTSRKYAWVAIPNKLVAGQRYTVKLLQDAEITSDGITGIYDGTVYGSTYLGGFKAVTGTDVEFSFNFTAIEGPMYFRAASNAVGGVGKFIHLKNIRIFPYSDKDYYSLPQISERLDEYLPNITGASLVGYYNGERIPRISERYQIGYKKLFNNVSCQGGSVYGDYWFQFANQHASISIYDLRTGTLHSTVTMTSKLTDHCNNVCFSNIFYDENDAFPLIYTSGSSTDSYNHVQVWRIQFIENVFTIEQVQEIIFPTGSENNPIWYLGQAYLDNELGYMWYAPHDSNTAIYLKYKIPPIFDSDNNVISEVTLTEEDALDRFTAQRGGNQQGGAVHNGVLYLLDGVPSRGTLTKLLVIDLRQKRLINIIDIYHILGITAEFEGAGIYNDTLIAATNGQGVYAIYF